MIKLPRPILDFGWYIALYVAGAIFGSLTLLYCTNLYSDDAKPLFFYEKLIILFYGSMSRVTKNCKLPHKNDWARVVKSK